MTRLSHSLGCISLSGAIGVATAGCGLPLSGALQEIGNACAGDGSCGANGACIAGMCVATGADLAQLYLQVDVPPTAGASSGTGTLVDLGSLGIGLQGDRPSGFYFGDVDLQVPTSVDVSVVLAVSPVPPACADLQPAGGGLPLGVSLHPVVAPVGIPLTVYHATSASNDNVVRTTVPPGDYDLHIAPEIPDGYADCQIPPFELKNQSLRQATVHVDLTGEAPTTLAGSFDVLGLDDWQLDLVENGAGRVMSTAGVLVSSPSTGRTDFTLSFWNNSNGVDAVIRLVPPPDLGAKGMPMVLWKVSAVDLDADLDVELSVSSFFDGDDPPETPIEPIEVGGTVLTATAEAVPAIVLIQSVSLLDGSFGGNATFKTHVDTDPDGDFTVMLLPGKYRVTAVPTSNTALAITTTDWELTAGDLGKGRTIVVNPRSQLSGVAVTPDGAPAPAVPALLEPTTGQAETYMQQELGTSQPGATGAQPQNIAAATGAMGQFQVALDPGSYDMWLRPDASTLWPWLVLTGITIPPTNPPYAADLHTVRFTNPVVLAGQVSTAAGATIDGATVRAWLVTNAPNSDEARPTAVQIAETRSGANGSYQLQLPASVTQ